MIYFFATHEEQKQWIDEIADSDGTWMIAETFAPHSYSPLNTGLHNIGPNDDAFFYFAHRSICEFPVWKGESADTVRLDMVKPCVVRLQPSRRVGRNVLLMGYLDVCKSSAFL